MNNSQQPTGTVYNALTSGSKIIGTIVAESDIRVDGSVEGDMQCSGKVVIGEQGKVKGTVICQFADVYGKVEGKMEIQQTLTLRSSANIKGEVKTETLIVEPNAIFNGTCSMGKKEAPAPKSK